MPKRGWNLATAAAAALVAIGLFGLTGLGVAAQDAESVTVALDEENDSGVTGTAVLTADGDQTIVVVELDGGEEGWEGHAFDSTCDDHRSATIFYPIEPLDADGVSESVFDAPLDELTSGDYWIHLHRPGGEFGEGVSCGNILAAATGGNLPTTGVGPATGAGLGAWLVVALAAGIAACGGSFLVRRRATSR